MKRLLIVGCVGVFGVMALASCEKDYTCECDTTVNGLSLGASSITITDTKKNATEECEAGSSDASIGGVTTSVSCELQ